MAIINCPNCGKRTFDDDKCQWCKYVIKTRKHPFDKQKYDVLKEEYKKNPHKSLVIKIGLEKYGMDLPECKRIVDYIATEEFEKDNYVSKENFKEYAGGLYKFSFWQYFIRNFLYKIIVAVVLFGLVKNAEELAASLIFMVMLAVWSILSLYSLIKATTIKFVFDAGKIEYSRRSSTFAAPGGKGYEGRMTGIHFEDRMDKKITYGIKKISRVKESIFSISVDGSVQYEVIKFLESGKNRVLKNKTIDHVRIPKYFKKNSEIIERLKGK